MGLFGNEVRREFIARPDAAKGQILYKWPDTNIRKLSQLTVEQDEQAVFFRDGQVQGTISPGRSTLDSSEIPFLGKLVDAASGGNLFKTELYFVSTREFPDLPFGGSIDNVVDPDTGLAVGLRVFGSGWAILGIASHTEEIEATTIDKVQANVNTYGCQIVRLGNFTISIKEEDEATLKGLRKDVAYTKLAGGFQQYAAGEALLGVGEGASQGGGALPPALLGVGLGMGQQVAGAAGQQMAAGGAIQVRCGNCNTLNPESAKFCSSCGQALAAPAPAPTGATVKCPECGTENAANAKFCANCGHALEPAAAAAPAVAPSPPQASEAPPEPGAAPPEGGGPPPPAPEAES